jgi:hypothetical protein
VAEASKSNVGAGGAVKTCVACGQDCSNKPRSKDAQGRYTCKGCLDRVQAATRAAGGGRPGSVVVKPVAAASSEELTDRVAKSSGGGVPGARGKATAGVERPSESDFMAIFGKEPPKIGDPCEQCGDAMPPGGRICVRCGFDRESGKRMKTRVQAAPQERGPSKLGAAAGSLGSTGFTMARLLAEPAVFSALGFVGLLLLYFAATTDEALVNVYIGCLGIYSLVGWLSMVVTAFKDGNAGWGILGIVSLFIPIGVFPVVYYLLMVAERRWLTMMWIGTIILSLLSYNLIYQHMMAEG